MVTHPCIDVQGISFSGSEAGEARGKVLPSPTHPCCHCSVVRCPGSSNVEARAWTCESETWSCCLMVLEGKPSSQLASTGFVADVDCGRW